MSSKILATHFGERGTLMSKSSILFQNVKSEYKLIDLSSNLNWQEKVIGGDKA